MNTERMVDKNSDSKKHIAWADYIKSFHATLQEEMRKSLAAHDNNEKQNATNETVSDSVPDYMPCDELAHWQAMMLSQNTSWQESMKHYANAMYRLATEYWSSQSTTKVTKEKEYEEEYEVISKEPTTSSSSSLSETSKKEQLHYQELPKQTQQVNDNDKKDDSNCETSRRWYNDRIKLCLECIEDYFLGKINPTLLCKQSINSKDEECNNQKQQRKTTLEPPLQNLKTKELVTATAATWDTVPLFAQLPRILARQVKPLRQAFFREHHRVASLLEIEQMFYILVQQALARIEQEEKQQKHNVKENLESLQQAPLCASSKSNCNTDHKLEFAANIQHDCILTALSYVVQCVQSKSNEVDHLHFLHQMYFDLLHKLEPEQELRDQMTCKEGMHNGEFVHSLPPLRVLDVGSCYGAFCGKTLSHAILGPIPLEVIAIDLEPIESTEYLCNEKSKEEQWRECSGSEAKVTKSKTEYDDRQSKRQRVEENIFNSHEVAHNKTSVKEKVNDNSAFACKVWRCDWLSVKFYNFTEKKQQEQKEEHELHKPLTNSFVTAANGLLRLQSRDANTINQYENCNAHKQYVTNSNSNTRRSSDYQVYEIAAASFDVVLFCLLLSFMPTPRLRFRACLHAYLALKPNGLLVIVCTRTQGSRHGKWVQEWVKCIEHIGFARIHQRMHKQLIILSFAKTTNADAYCRNVNISTEGVCGSNNNDDDKDNDLNSAEKREKWIQAQMQSNVVNNLRIIADDKLEHNLDSNHNHNG